MHQEMIYLVEGNLSRVLLLATNLSPPTSRMTHFPSQVSPLSSPFIAALILQLKKNLKIFLRFDIRTARQHCKQI